MPDWLVCLPTRKSLALYACMFHFQTFVWSQVPRHKLEAVTASTHKIKLRFGYNINLWICWNPSNKQLWKPSSNGGLLLPPFNTIIMIILMCSASHVYCEKWVTGTPTQSILWLDSKYWWLKYPNVWAYTWFITYADRKYHLSRDLCTFIYREACM